MTERERLIDKIKRSLFKNIYERCKLSESIADDLLADGIIVPLCKVGDTVYHFSGDFGVVLPYFVENLNVAYLGENGEKYVYTFEANCNYENELLDSIDFESKDIGKTVFLTKEEAERRWKI